MRHAESAFTRVFDALWTRCRAGAHLAPTWVPALRCTAKEALHRARDKRVRYTNHPTAIAATLTAIAAVESQPSQ